MKLNLVVTSITERARDKGVIKVSADKDINAWNIISSLNIDAKKGEFEVGDKLIISVEKAKKGKV